MSNQLSLAWNKLDAELQRDVPRPKSDTTIASFVEQLEERKDMWKRLFSQPHCQAPYQYGGQQRRFEQPFRRPEYPPRRFEQPPHRPEHPSNRQNAPNNAFENAPNLTQYRGYNEQPWNRPPPRNIAGTERQPCRIEYPPNNQRNKPQWARRNADMPRPAYFAEADPYEYEDAAPYNDVDNTDIEPLQADVFFNNSAQPRHSNPPFSCQKCSMTFRNSEDLRSHTLDYHGVDTHSSTSIDAAQYANYVEHAVQNVVVVPPPPIHGYTAVKASLFRPDKDPQTVCLDTGSTTTFVDQSLVDNAIIKKTPPITAKGFSGSQVLDQYVEMPLYIATSSSPSSRLRLNTMAYIVDNLRAGVLLGTDTLAKEGASLDLKRKKLILDDKQADIVYKLPDSPVGMHVCIRPTMHEIHRQRRLKYAAFSTQFHTKTSAISLYTQATPPSPIHAKSSYKLTPRHTSKPHLTMDDLRTQFRVKTSAIPSNLHAMPSSCVTRKSPCKSTLPSCQNVTLPHLTVTDLYARFHTNSGAFTPSPSHLAAASSSL